MGRRVVSGKKAPKLSALYAVPGPTPVSPPDGVQPDNYITKLVKYIPSEIVAVYIFVEGILKSLNAAWTLEWVLFGLLLLLTPVYMWRVTSDKTKPTAWAQIIIAFLSFAIWVFAIGGPFLSLAWYNPLYGSILVAFFTLVVPIVNNN